MKSSDARKADPGKGFSSSFLVFGIIAAEILIYLILRAFMVI